MRQIDTTEFVGKTIIHGTEVTFKFSDYILYLYLSEELARDLLMDKLPGGGWEQRGNKELDFDRLECYTLDDKFQLYLFFDKNNYGSSNAIFGNTTLKIFVYRYFIYTKDRSEKNIITLYSKQFHRFLGMIPSVNITPIQNKEASGTIDFKFESVKQEKDFELNGNHLTIVPNYKLFWNGPDFEFVPGITLRFENSICKEEMSKIYDTLISMLHFVFMRTNIYPDLVEYQNGDEKGEIKNYVGEVYDEGKEETTSIWRDSIPWHLLYENIDNLFKTIYSNEIHMLHIPEKKRHRVRIDLVSISKDAAAFESEFDTVFPDGVPYSEERKNIEEEIVSEITPLMNAATSKKKKIYKGFIKHVHAESLCDKIEYALEEYSECIEYIKNKFAKTLSNEKIAEICSNIRNDVDHGNKIEGLNDDVASGFVVLRALIYALQLRRCGFDDEKVALSVRQLFQLSGYNL